MNVKISYQTLTAPPPFAFGYTFELDFSEQLSVRFELEYLNRDELSTDEIEAEGFGDSDNFSWSGSLPAAWKVRLVDLFEKLALNENAHDPDTWLYVQIVGSGARQGHPANIQDVEYIFQELMQAVLEKSGREDKLALSVIVPEQIQSKIDIKASFVALESSLGDRPISWDKLKDILTILYSVEPGENFEKKPKSKGIWVDFSGQGFYQPLKLPAKHSQTLVELLRS